ncbi:hypothetical protein Gotri_024274, partial [Gossypium trilobum]|nr:hypothetical protein [Gossypium trilobum]
MDQLANITLYQTNQLQFTSLSEMVEIKK